jgi:hypothetical protein
MVKRGPLFTFLFLLLFAFSSNAACTLTAKCTGGDWTAASTWTSSGCGAQTVPGNNTIIIIPDCAIVTMDVNSVEYVNMEVYVYGDLVFENGMKLNMCPGYVKVFPTGTLGGGTPGSKINICGTTVWNGGSTTSGPLEFGTGTTLPVELTSFHASLKGESVQLDWTTASEDGNDYFTVQRSADGSVFEDLMEVDGAGYSTVNHTYQAEDKDPLNGTSFYRLKQTDFDGHFAYSQIAEINYKQSVFSFEVSPNPTSGSVLNLKLSGAVSGQISVRVLSLTGAVISRNEVFLSEGQRELQLDLGERTVTGCMYTIELRHQEQSHCRKFVVN